MPEKPPEETVALVIAGLVEPDAIRGRAIDVVEARAAEHLAGEFDAFLRRVGLDRMQAPDPRREPIEESELQLNLPAAGAEPRRAMPGIGIDRLPDARGAVDRILRQQSVEKSRAAARQAGDEDRRREGPRRDRGLLALGVREDEKCGEHPLQVPAGGEAAERRETRLFLEA